jgi:hypothetical protein
MVLFRISGVYLVELDINHRRRARERPLVIPSEGFKSLEILSIMLSARETGCSSSKRCMPLFSELWMFLTQ